MTYEWLSILCHVGVKYYEDLEKRRLVETLKSSWTLNYYFFSLVKHFEVRNTASVECKYVGSIEANGFCPSEL